MTEILSAIGICFTGFLAYFLVRRGRNGDLNPDDPVIEDKEYTQTDVDDIIETTYEVLEQEEEYDEEFDNKVERIAKTINDFSNDELVEYVNNNFLGVGETHHIIPSEDRARFEWESKLD